MKKLIFLFFVCFSFYGLQAQEAISLEEALKKGYVQATMQGNEDSPHYLKPLKIILKNLANKVLTIYVESGYYFASEPADYQDILALAKVQTSLKPQETRSMDILGVCTEAHNAPPKKSVAYQLQKAPKATYLPYAQFIEQEKLYATSEAQHGMWVLSDNYSLSEIYGHHNQGKTGEKIIEKIAQITQMPKPNLAEIKKAYQVNNNNQMTNPPQSVLIKSEASGKFSYKISRAAKVQIGMFDDKGILVREIYNNQAETPGFHEVKYSFDTLVYPDDVYHFKMIRDGQIWLTMKMDKKNMRPADRN
jgi:hypothetical protein